MEGHCLCAAVRVRVDGDHDPRIGACHCRMCQRWSGGLFIEFEADAAGVRVTGDVARYRSSSFAERAFCPTCGTHLWFRDIDPDDAPYELMPGLFDAALGWPLRSEVYADRAMAAIRLEGDHRRTTQAEYESNSKFVEGDAP